MQLPAGARAVISEARRFLDSQNGAPSKVVEMIVVKPGDVAPVVDDDVIPFVVYLSAETPTIEEFESSNKPKGE